MKKDYQDQSATKSKNSSNAISYAFLRMLHNINIKMPVTSTCNIVLIDISSFTFLNYISL